MRSLKMNAREQLKVNGQFNRELAAMCGQSTSRNLLRRQKDYEVMVGHAGWKAPQGAFHKPGSLKK
jgi:hypothetical protein